MKQLHRLMKWYKKQPEYITQFKLNQELARSLKDINVFIIEKEIPNTEGKVTPEKTDITPLNIPFEVCWLEGFNIRIEDTTVVAFAIQELSPEYQAVHVFTEKIVAKKGLYFNQESFSVQNNKMGMSDTSKSKEIYIYYLLLSQKILPLIKRESLIFTEPKEEIKFKQKIKGQTVTFKGKPKNVIYIADKKTFADLHTSTRVLSKQEHQYEVMGHWRKLINPEAIGKDRKGQRTTEGYTWVVPFIKGPKDAPLIKKVRKVK